MKTAEYEFYQYPFESFNPVQSAVAEYIGSDCNLVVAAPTSSGKTICGELIAGYYLFHTGLISVDKIIYTSPLKALAEEKYEDWTSQEHPWNKHSVVVMTGDYQMTEARQKEVHRADIIVSTYEMLAVRSRRAKHESIQWLLDTAVIIIDEAHFLSSEGRGDHLENALIGFTRLNPRARIVFLSATMRNAKIMAEWLTLLNGKPTELVESTYRPCHLQMHYETYSKPNVQQFRLFEAEKQEIIATALDLIEHHKQDQWLLFAHSKAYGREMWAALTRKYPGQSAFHNADQSKESRKAIETSFKDGRLRYLVATSTLAYGLNLPARMVIILGVKRGMAYVDPLDIIQECGRAGRPKYDTAGDAYVILENSQLPEWTKLLSEGIDVKSRLPHKVGFHLIGEIAEGRVDSPDTAHHWADRTLANKQGLWSASKVSELFDSFKKEGLIYSDLDDWTDEEVKSNYAVTKLGKIASINYFDPFDVTAWKKNIVTIRSRDLTKDDAAVAWALTNCPSVSSGFIPKEMRSLTNEYLFELRRLNLFVSSDGFLSKAAVLYNQIQGQDHVVSAFPAMLTPIVMDAPRIISCLYQIDSMVLSNRDRGYWDSVLTRILYGVGWEAAELCKLDGIGRVNAERLIGAGINSIDSFIQQEQFVKTLLSEATFDKSMSSAKKLKGATNENDDVDLHVKSEREESPSASGVLDLW